MATAAIYCTHKELKRVFPQLDSFDGKKPIYGWGASPRENLFDASLDLAYNYDTGLVEQLFVNGVQVNKIAYNTTETTKLNGGFSKGATTIDVDGSHGLEAGVIIKVDNEYIRIDSVSTNTLTVVAASDRGLFDTAAVAHADDASVYLIIDHNVDTADSTSQGQDALGFIYDTDKDLLLLIHHNLTLEDYNVEAGEGFTTLVTQFRTDASRYLDSMLDPNLPKEALKDKEGNFDYIIIRTTSLLAANFMIKSKDPNSELANSLLEEANMNIENINQGRAALSWQVTRDSSQGVVRDVTYTSGQMRPVDTRGEWSGTYDLIKVTIGTGGVLGTATYNVYIKDGDKLKNQQIITNKVINGDYQ